MKKQMMQNFEINQLCLIAIVFSSIISMADAFSYKDAKNWGKEYHGCLGKHQSPIIYTPRGHEGFPSINKTMKLTDFQKLPKKLTIKNTGHTVEIKADWSGKPPMCSGGPLNGSYVFEKATLHWAPKKWVEEVDPNAQDEDLFMYEIEMEMHMFFYRKDLKSFKKAETHKGGLAVLKMTFQKFQGGGSMYDCSFGNLDKNLHKVQSPNTSAEITAYPLLSSFDQTYTTFIFYEGSLDYPPCSESVTWFISEAVANVDDSLVDGLKKIKLSDGDVSNVRPTQPLNKREVKMVYTRKDQEKKF